MSERDALRETLAARAGAAWEIYSKRSRVREHRWSAGIVEESEREETGFAARWQRGPGSAFAAGTSPRQTRDALDLSESFAAPGPAAAFPGGSFPEAGPEPAPPSPANPAEELAPLVAGESKGAVRLVSVFSASAVVTESLENGSGLSAMQHRSSGYLLAQAAAQSEDRRASVRLLVPAGGESAAAPRLARAIADRCAVALKGGPMPLARGELLLDPSIGAAILSATLPLFCGREHRTLLSRKYLDRGGRFGAELLTLLDEPAPGARFDGEGSPCRARAVVESGIFRSRLHDLVSARRCGESPTGNAWRPSYRRPPSPGSACLRLVAKAATPAPELLAGVGRGLCAVSLLAPVSVDLEEDRLELEVDGWIVERGRARGAVAKARVSGRLSEFWRGIVAAGDDPRAFLEATQICVPSLLVARAVFRFA